MMNFIDKYGKISLKLVSIHKFFVNKHDTDKHCDASHKLLGVTILI